jgi:hypothetical protein
MGPFLTTSKGGVPAKVKADLGEPESFTWDRQIHYCPRPAEVVK